MAAYAALVSLMNIIEQMKNHPRLSTSFDNNQIQSLQQKADLLLDFIEGYSYGGVLSKQVEDLERRIASAAHTAEDMIESHIVNQILARSTDDGEAGFSFSLYLRKKMGNEQKRKSANEQKRMENVAEDADPMTHIVDEFRAGSNRGSLSCSHYLQQIIQDMDALMEKADELKEEEREEKPQHSRPHMESGESAMVGCGDELIQIMDKLTNQQSRRLIISIVGMGGMGKTTLARNVYENLIVKGRFDILAWATVSQQYNVEEILSQLLFGQGKSYDKTYDALGEQLHKTLSGRRYLIILDDIWSVEAWDGIRRFFPDNGNGSRIVLTTRLSSVANDCGSSCFQKNLLDEIESWELFCEKAFGHNDCPTELGGVGKEIVKLCRGLPLSIVVIGGSLLKSPRTLRYWNSIAKDIKSIPNSKEKQESLDVLLSSYNHLPPHLKPCFLHIGFYKSGYSEINVSNIIKLWVAEGFLKPNGAQVLEEMAKDYLDELIGRNLILVGRRYDNGKMKSFDIHDLLRDLCLKVAEPEEFFHVTGCLVRGTERRVIYTSSMEETGLPLARSIMAYEVGNQKLDKHRLLRIVDVSDHMSAEESFGCVNLRYLALPRNYDLNVWQLPSSVSLLWNLQSLIFNKSWCQVFRVALIFNKSWCQVFRVAAPIEIWKMRQLRHIKCYEIYVPHPPPSDGQDNLFILENFQTLGNAVNFKLSEEMCNIIPNIKNLRLIYDQWLRGYDDCLIECLSNLGSLHRLESLRLVTDTKLNKIVTFPRSLNKLALCKCKLHWNDLTMIGSLPLLEILKLEPFSVTEGEHWSPVEGQFLRLKCLEISNCYLRCWNADSCHFPILEKLVVRDLSYLEEIPGGIGEIPTLKLIHVDNCRYTAAISAVKIKEDQLEFQGIDDLQIQVSMYKLESFIEMVEKEGLTVDNIQLNT